MSDDHDLPQSVLLDDTVEFSLSEVCHSCRVDAEVVIQLVDFGVVEPRGRDPADWRFPGHAIQRLDRALNLQRDLEINLAGAALALELLDEIDRLRGRLRMLEGE